MSGPAEPPDILLDEFRRRYYDLSQRVYDGATAAEALSTSSWERLGNELDEFTGMVMQHQGIFPGEEFVLLQHNLSLMQNDIRLHHSSAISSSHHGHPTVIEEVHSGGRGRPAIHIDRDFLQWAYSLRSVSSIARFLGVHRTTVRRALIFHGLAEAQDNPFLARGNHPDVADGQADDFLDPQVHPADQPQVSSYTGPVSSISNEQLDLAILQLRQQFPRAGVTMLHGMLLTTGHNVPRRRISESLLRIDPVQRVFDRIRIRRRVYSVPGPNALWHHDGQHGLIRYGIVIHGFIDGYSRLITALRASNNNRAETVLDVFLSGASTYGVPSRLRGDHGVENLQVAAWMEQNCGERRGSYLWGRSVHNVRIERLWVDVTAQVGSQWQTAFTNLELRHGLNINNPHHIWLLHYLFLPVINQQLSFFAESWNHHRIQIRGGPNRSPADMFGFDMLVHGVRGQQLPPLQRPPPQYEDHDLPEEELEVYGIDWTAFRDDQLLRSLRGNNSQTEEGTSWIGRTGPPPNLNEVPLDPPDAPGQEGQFGQFQQEMGQWIRRLEEQGQDVTIEALWTTGLAAAQHVYGNIM
ncbi:hypothetical protein NMY22_g16776 [Coprinellus aureogranulatus]|nr:hypothetical protein NMY22_g16776 [Coprinellus aureogranulatus]